LFEKGAINFASAAKHFAQGVPEFIGGTQARISIVGDIDKAAFRAQATSRADAHPGSNTGTIVGIQYSTHLLHINRDIRVILKFKFFLNTFQFGKFPHFFIRNPKQFSNFPNSNVLNHIAIKAGKFM